MDELRLIQIWVIATLGGVVGAGFVYVRRVEAGPAARLWAWAWLSFFVSLIVSVWPVLLFEVIAHATGTAFPALLLAGTLAFVGRWAPRWLVPAALGIGALRGLAHYAGYPIVSQLGVYLVEAPLDFLAAALLIQASRTNRRTPAVATLGFLLACFGVLEISNVHYIGGVKDAPFGYFALGGLATLVLALTQMLALVERARITHGRDLALLHDIAQSGTREQTQEGVTIVALEGLRERLDLFGGAIWLLRPEVYRLECIHYVGTSEPMPPDIASWTADVPISQRALGGGEPIFMRDILVDSPVPMASWFGEMGIRSAALLPLIKDDKQLGLVALCRDRVDPFDESERRILRIASDEIFLALEHVGAVQRLAAERRVLSAVVETSPTGVLVTSRDRSVEIVNATFMQHVGERSPEQWIGKHVDSLASKVAARFLESDDFTRLFLRHDDDEIRPAGFTTPLTLTMPEVRELLVFTTTILSDDDEPLGRVWVTRDVSEERKLEEQLRQSQKLETLGTLAGGVAHDFNNQLTAILGNARILLAESANSREQRESLHDIERAAEHCAGLTQSLLAFARRTPLSMQGLRPERVLEQVGVLLRSLLPSTIHFDIAIEPGLPPVTADSTQLQQMLINLVVNARDAVAVEGHIRVEVKRRDVVVSQIEEDRPGLYVEFAVSDDGTGMDAGTRQRIFDPFFTTKDVSEGTGLGLAVVYGAAHAHRGWVEVESKPGEGSIFRVLIPAAESTEERAAPARSPRPARGIETILLADDEPKLRRLLARTLRSNGYEVIEADNGGEAVRCFERHAADIALAVLDVTMPLLDGVAALARMRALRPELPAVLMSGLLEIDESVLATPHTVFLAKPYDLDQVTESVRRLIDAAH